MSGSIEEFTPLIGDLVCVFEQHEEIGKKKLSYLNKYAEIFILIKDLFGKNEGIEKILKENLSESTKKLPECFKNI